MIRKVSKPFPVETSEGKIWKVAVHFRTKREAAEFSSRMESERIMCTVERAAVMKRLADK